MTAYLSLLRKSQTIIEYLNEHLSTESQSDITEIFSMMHRLQSIFPQWVLLSCPAQHPKMFFITDNCEQVLGYKQVDFTRANQSGFLLSKIHEDDLDDMYSCFSYIESYLKETMPEEYIHLRFVMHYRFRHKSGHYLTIHHEQAMLPLRESDPLYYSIMKDNSSGRIFDGVKLEIYSYDSVFRKLVEYYPGREQRRLSKREYEILGLMQTGLSTKQIAQRLNISHHTARNIKQKMFEKYKVNNSIELLNRFHHVAET